MVRIMNKQNVIKSIGQLCQLIPGAAKSAYSKKQDSTDLKSVFILKGKDVNKEGFISTEDMEKAQLLMGKNIDRYILLTGDVVVMSRGSAIRAAIVTEETAAKEIVASSNFIIIRPDQNKIKGEVIVAYLNSGFGQKLLLALNTGAVIQHIPTSSLRDLEIPVPPLNIQNNISDIFNAGRDAYVATEILMEQQKRTVNASILNMMMA